MFEAIVTVSPAVAAPAQLPVCAADALVLLPRDIQCEHDKIVRAVRCGVYIKGELGGIHSGSHFPGLQGIAPVHVGRRTGAWPGLARVLVSVLAPPAPIVGRST